MAHIEQEIDNLRAVLKRLIQHAPQAGLRMTLNLFRLWQASGHLQEGREWFALALAHPESISADVRAHAYREVGFLTICMNKIEEAEELFAQSFAIYQKLDTTDRQVIDGLASVLNRQSLVPLFRGDYAHTLHLCHQGLAMARGSGSQWQASTALFFAGEALYHPGLFAQSQSTYEESLRLCDAVGNLRSSGRRLVRLGHVACAQGELTQANSLFKKGLLVASESYDRPGISFALVGLARAAALCGAYQRAAILTAAKEEVATTNPIARYWPMDRIENERTLTLLHTHLDEATFVAAWAEGAAMSVEQAMAYALSDCPNV
ncbi:MAG: hypothetical protein R3E79_28100 [Caldilineaceae bacterium]